MLWTGQLPSIQDTVHCNECVLGKEHRHPFHGSIYTAARPGNVTHSDMVGPLPPSHSGSCYLAMLVDEFTRYVTIFALIRKSAELDTFKFAIVYSNVIIQLQSRLSTQTMGGGGVRTSRHICFTTWNFRTSLCPIHSVVQRRR
jgi:hypothetical protein